MIKPCHFGIFMKERRLTIKIIKSATIIRVIRVCNVEIEKMMPPLRVSSGRAGRLESCS